MRKKSICILLSSIILLIIGIIFNINKVEAKGNVAYGFTMLDSEKQIVEIDTTVVERDATEAIIPKTVEIDGKEYTVVSIGKDAFWSCDNLTKIVIPDSVTSIGNNAFKYCENLQEITIPDSVTSIGWGAFGFNTKLTKITLPKNLYRIQDSTFKGCTNLAQITMPEGITSIGREAFYDCSSLKEITIPNKVTSIGIQSFHNCSSLTNIVIPKKVNSIAENAFEYCTNLEEVVILEGVTDIETKAFYSCSNLKKVTIPDTVTSIGKQAFCECRKLSEVNIPDSITSIEEGTFYNCNNLTKIVLPNSITSIGNEAFRSCGYTFIVIPESVTSIGKQAFSSATIEYSVVIPKTVTSIGSSAFGNNTRFITIYTYEDSQGQKYAKENNIKYELLEKQELKYNILDEEKATAEVCGINNWEITNVVIPKTIQLNKKQYTVTGIGYNAFYNENITQITIPDTITSIGSRAFRFCGKLTNIIIPNSVTYIGRETFDYCKGLTQITLPNGIKTIKKWTFTNCKGLTKIEIPRNVTNIGQRAFDYCDNLTEIIISDGVKTIGEEAFMGCVNLKKVTIPKSVEEIEYGVFADCNNELTIYTYKNSEGHNYAKKNNIKYVLLDENEEITNPKPFPFVDVKESDWYYNSVKFVYDRKIILGTTDTTFNPKNNLTRGQLVTILWRMEGSKKINAVQKFPDVKIDTYYYDAVKWASANKIVNGYSDGKFKPNNNITREQLAIMLYNYAKYKGKNGKAPTEISKYIDYKKVNDYAIESVKWAISNKIISGKENGTKIEPQGNATRAEAAAMIQNYLTYVK